LISLKTPPVEPYKLGKTSKVPKLPFRTGAPIAFGSDGKPMYGVAKGHTVRPDQRSDFGLKMQEGRKKRPKKALKGRYPKLSYLIQIKSDYAKYLQNNKTIL
jgi:hypothetical protein